MTNIAIVTDTLPDQINGVVRSLNSCVAEIKHLGHSVQIIHAGMFRSLAVPFYPEVRLAYNIDKKLLKTWLGEVDHIHILTEGTLGKAARKLCVKNNWNFTTSFLTKHAEFLKKMIWFPEWITNAYLRWFHKKSSGVMVATPNMEEYVKEKGYNQNTLIWQKGVDNKQFRPMPPKDVRRKPILLYVGRVSYEKGIEDFLGMDIDAHKIVVGGGPACEKLKYAYNDVEFVGYLHGDDLAQAYSDADVFVFPSRTDTFGLVIVEALACGTPVAAYPVTGPKDILQPGTGATKDDLKEAVEIALNESSKEACLKLARKYSWVNSAKTFVDNLKEKDGT